LGAKVIIFYNFAPTCVKKKTITAFPTSHRSRVKKYVSKLIEVKTEGVNINIPVFSKKQQSEMVGI
jgi:hypothetical protein